LLRQPLHLDSLPDPGSTYVLSAVRPRRGYTAFEPTSIDRPTHPAMRDTTTGVWVPLGVPHGATRSRGYGGRPIPFVSSIFSSEVHGGNKPSSSNRRWAGSLACLQDAGTCPANARVVRPRRHRYSLASRRSGFLLAATPQAHWCDCSFAQQGLVGAQAEFVDEVRVLG
jgi:hypothetical protein